MIKLLIFCISILVASLGQSQSLLRGENGKVRFFSDAPLEDIEATTTKPVSALNISTGEVAVLIPIKSFVFDKGLMQEHFNENYMESSKFPEASFNGKIGDKFNLSVGESSQVKVSGNLTIHGVSQRRDIQLNLKLNADGSILATGKFNIKVADYNIKVPSIVFQKIAEVVELTFELTLKPMTKP